MKRIESGFGCRQAVLCVAIALGLSACGGGSNTRPIPVTPATPPPPTPPVPPTPPPPTPPTDQPPLDAQLSITNTYAAHNQGYTGAGVVIGVVDSGIMRNHPSLAGRVTKELIYIDSGTNNTAMDDVIGHGTWVSEIAAGQPFAKFPGGIAPGANLVSARILSDARPKDDGSGKGNPVTADDAAFFAQTLNPALINAGVQVMNNSWGGIYWDITNASINNAFSAAYDPFVLQHGGLAVFAAGNDSRPDPSDIAALPSLAPELEKGWLAVVAVDSNHPSQLASYSNACGKAMTYCLAAAGDVIVSGKDDTPTSATYWIVSGTSLAAPQVTGAAALVWQAFPYFNNDLVRQTLLGTADDLGAAGPDPVFGYGELNVGKAVNGPEKFDWGDVTVNFTGNSDWNNAISGAGGLIKKGTGALSLTQAASYTGLTQVQGGTLSAKSLASAVNIGAQGTLRQTHAIDGNVSNAGVLSVGGGDVTIGGNYLQQGSGRLALSLGSALHVAGSANLAGGDLYVIGTDSGYTASSTTPVLSAAGGLSGTFSGLNKASNVTLLDASLLYDYSANLVTLDVKQVQATAIQGMSYTAASYGSAQRVDGAFAAINSQLSDGGVNTSAPIGNEFVAAAGALQQSPTLQTTQRSLESLSGQLHAASAAMTFEAIDAGTRALSDRFDDLLSAPKAGAWTQSLGYHGNMSRGGYSNVGYDLSGWMIGADQLVGGRGVVGYALSQSQGLGRLAESADQGQSHALEGMLYGGVMHGSWYTMGRLGMGSFRENMRRELQLGTQFTAVASASNGRYGVAYGESGYRFALGGAQITPYVNLQYAQVTNDGFNEVGGYGFGLKSAAQKAERWQAGVGLRATQQWTLARGGSLSLQTRMSWQHSFAVNGEAFAASFNGVNQFASLGGIGLSRYGGVIGTTLNWAMTPRASLQLGYDQYLGQQQQATMATAGFNWKF